MHKRVVSIGILFAMLGVILGAFGAHGLKGNVTAEMLSSFETGVRYQMYHALTILIVGLIPQLGFKSQKIICGLFVLGIVLFSGSIYLLSTQAILPFSISGIGWITPVGGVFFIVGWLVFVVKILKGKVISD